MLQWTNFTSVISKWGTFSPILSLVILLLVLLCNFIVSGVTSWRWYPVFVLNIILFTILFMYILITGFWVTVSCFLRNIKNNLQYLIQNMIYQVIQTLYLISELIFKTSVFVWHFKLYWIRYIVSYTVWVISFARCKEYIICLILFSNFSRLVNFPKIYEFLPYFLYGQILHRIKFLTKAL